ncbi:hypothetical protein WN944_029488 [Citrus x changshan-huyou]|uniref:Uncharacterized protein n=1 Tax=Citrus x changshan-huyou TaxID=2935761 RepID=A0AAP0LLV5_9ROSI
MPVARNCFYWVSIGKNYQEKESFVECQRDFIETKLRGISQCADCEAEKDDEPVEPKKSDLNRKRILAMLFWGLVLVNEDAYKMMDEMGKCGIGPNSRLYDIDALQSRPCRYGNEDLRTDEVKGRAS